MTVVAAVAVAGVAAAAPSAHAQPPGLTDSLSPRVDTSRDTHRIMVGGGFAVFGNYPMAMADEGGAVLVGKPLWLGHRYSIFQWAAELQAVVGFGAHQKHGYVLASPQFGFNLYFGSVFGIESRWGLGGMAQVGERFASAIVFTGGGGYVFRFWDDDRKRIKLYASINFGAYLRSDAMNDTPMNAGAFVWALAYETPL